MLSTIDLRETEGQGVDYAAAVPRAAFDVAAAVERVLPICADVAARVLARGLEPNLRLGDKSNERESEN